MVAKQSDIFFMKQSVEWKCLVYSYTSNMGTLEVAECSGVLDDGV